MSWDIRASALLKIIQAKIPMYQLWEIFTLINIISMAIIAIIGACMGSFINVIIFRLPVMMWQQCKTEAQHILHLPDTSAPIKENLWRTSSCIHCQHKIAWQYNIPIISFIQLKGKCKYCKKAFSTQYFLVEILSMALCFAVFLSWGINLGALGLYILGLGLMVLSVIDIRHYLLPDIIVIPLLWLGLLLNTIDTYVALNNALWGAVLGYLFLWMTSMLFKYIRHQDGLGQGDCKLLSAIGAWFGAIAIVPITFIASLVALLLFLWCKTQKIPFGAAISMATICVIILVEKLLMHGVRLN